MRKRTDPIPHSEKRRLQLTVDAELAIRLNVTANIREVTPAEVIEDLIRSGTPPLPSEYMAVAG